jgi:hypothetical protein
VTQRSIGDFAMRTKGSIYVPIRQWRKRTKVWGDDDEQSSSTLTDMCITLKVNVGVGWLTAPKNTKNYPLSPDDTSEYSALYTNRRTAFETTLNRHMKHAHAYQKTAGPVSFAGRTRTTALESES